MCLIMGLVLDVGLLKKQTSWPYSLLMDGVKCENDKHNNLALL